MYKSFMSDENILSIFYGSFTIFYNVCMNSFIYRAGTLLIKISPPKIRAFIFLSFNAFYFIEHYIDLILFNDRVIFFFLKSPFNKICRQLRSYLAAKNRNLIFEFHCVTIAVLYRYKGFYSFVMLLLWRVRIFLLW